MLVTRSAERIFLCQAKSTRVSAQRVQVLGMQMQHRDCAPWKQC